MKSGKSASEEAGKVTLTSKCTGFHGNHPCLMGVFVWKIRTVFSEMTGTHEYPYANSPISTRKPTDFGKAKETRRTGFCGNLYSNVVTCVGGLHYMEFPRRFGSSCNEEECGGRDWKIKRLVEGGVISIF
jgi:hypothetical protein